MTTMTRECTECSVVSVEGALHAPVDHRLRQEIETLLQRDQRWLLLDLGSLTDIDAAGIGELLRIVRMTKVAGGDLHVSHARGHVRELLNRAGILKLLSPPERIQDYAAVAGRVIGPAPCA